MFVKGIVIVKSTKCERVVKITMTKNDLSDASHKRLVQQIK